MGGFIYNPTWEPQLLPRLSVTTDNPNSVAVRTPSSSRSVAARARLIAVPHVPPRIAASAMLYRAVFLLLAFVTISSGASAETPDPCLAEDYAEANCAHCLPNGPL